MSWKDDKNLGPWNFVEQPNKWGYLNNPRWVPESTDPINYNHNEADEPQVWDLNATSRGGGTRHFPCGHWHKKGGGEYSFQVYWELLNRSVSHPHFYDVRGYGYLLGAESFIYIDPDDFDGEVTWEFEAAAHNEHAFDVTLQVVDGDLNVCASIVFEAGLVGTDGKGTFRRRTTFTPTGHQVYGLRLLSDGDLWQWIDMYIYTARIIVTQVGATKTHLQIPMVGDSWNYVLEEYLDAPYDSPLGHGIYKSNSVPMTDFTNDWGTLGSVHTSQGFTTKFRYQQSEISNVNKITFTAMAKPWDNSNAAAHVKTDTESIFVSVPITDYDLVLYWAPSGSPTGACLSGVPAVWVDENQSHVDDCTGTLFTPIPSTYVHVGAYTHPWSVTMPIDLSMFNNYNGIIYIYTGGQINAGIWGHFSRRESIQINSGVGIRNATQTITHISGNQFRWVISWETYLLTPAGSTKIALANTADGAVVEDSILTWEPNEVMSRKYTEVSGLQDGEYEVVVLAENQIYTGANWTGDYPEFFDAQLWFRVDPISALHIWYRCMHHYFGDRDNQAVPAGWDCTSIEAKMKLEVARYAAAYFEATAYRAWTGPNTLYLRDMGTDDESGSGGSDVATLTFDGAVESRERKRIAVNLTVNNRYCSRQPNAIAEGGELWANNGFIILNILPD